MAGAGWLRFERGAGNIPALDGLRGIAILLVLFRHGIRPFVGDDGRLYEIGGWDAGSLFVNGWIGVDLFFVLSGFLITHQLLRRAGRGEPLRIGDYLMRRVFRIVPVYYVALVVVAAGAIPLYTPHDASAGEVLRHLAFLQDYGGSAIVPAFWSLGVEEKFYLAMPLLLALLLRARSDRTRFGILGAILGLSLALRTATVLSHPELTTYDAAFPVFRSPFHLNWDGFVVGIACALAYRAVGAGAYRIRASVALTAFWAGVATLAGLLLTTHLMDRPTFVNEVVLPSALALAFGAVLFGVLFRPRTAAGLLGGQALFVTAKVSYSLYLIHMTLIPLSLYLLLRLPAFGTLGARAQFPLLLVVYGALSFGAALVLHFAVEQPFLRLRQRLGRREMRTATTADRQSVGTELASS